LWLAFVFVFIGLLFSVEVTSPPSILLGLIAVKTNLLDCLAVAPIRDSLLPLVISASFSKVPLHRLKNDPLWFPDCKKIFLQ
jgi:hypothetical protein